MHIPQGSLGSALSAGVALATVWLIVTYISSVFNERKLKQEQQRWKKFRRDTNCVLIGIEETRFRGKKYIWKTKDGIIVINKHKD